MATEKPKQVPPVDLDVDTTFLSQSQKKSSRGQSESFSSEKSRRKGTISPVMISSASPSISQGSGQTRPLPSHAGIQYDQYEKSFAAKSLAKDPLPTLVTWPQDSVLIEEQKRKLRTSKPSLPVRTSRPSYSVFVSLFGQNPLNSLNFHFHCIGSSLSTCALSCSDIVPAVASHFGSIGKCVTTVTHFSPISVKINPRTSTL